MTDMVKIVTGCDKKSTKRKELLMTKSNKKGLIKAMVESLGNITSACQKCGLSRQTYFRYMHDDSIFRKQIEDIPEMRLDFVENQLNKLIKDKHPAAIIFFLKCKGKNRDYIERTEIDASVHSDRLTGRHFSEAWKQANETPAKRLEQSKKK